MIGNLPGTRGTADGPTVDGASASLLGRLLKELERELVEQDVPVSDYLARGASPAEVREAFASCGLIAPDEAVVWFGWHNGPTGVGNSVKALPMFHFWSLDDCVRANEDPKGQPKGLSLIHI